MRRVSISGLAFLSVLAFAALGSSTALAAAGPLYAYCHHVGSGGRWEDHHCEDPALTEEGEFEKTNLQAGETLDVSASAVGTQKLGIPALAFTIECKKLKLASGANLKGGDPGTDEEKLEYEECELPSTSCKINGERPGKITTETLSSTLVYLSKAASEKLTVSATGTLFKPTGTKFAEFTVGPVEAGCSVNLTLVPKNELVVENTDAPGVNVLLHTLTAPATAIKSYWNAAGEETKIKTLAISGFPAIYEGETSVTASEPGGLQVAWWIA
jgi:hypothetical protein